MYVRYVDSCVWNIRMFLGQAPVREVLPRLLGHQELQGEFAHPLKKKIGWAKVRKWKFEG